MTADITMPSTGDDHHQQSVESLHVNHFVESQDSIALEHAIHTFRHPIRTYRRVSWRILFRGVCNEHKPSDFDRFYQGRYQIL